jgi:hypothetical protein
METTVVATFTYRHEAEMARSFLELEGIEAMVATDDAGGAYPGIISRARVIVRSEDADAAREVLHRADDTTEVE